MRKSARDNFNWYYHDYLIETQGVSISMIEENKTSTTILLAESTVNLKQATPNCDYP